MRKHLATLLDDFRRFDREIAVVRIHGNRRRITTYGEIARLAGRFATFLDRHGVRQGDRVVLWAENSAEWVAGFYGIMLRGALAVPLDAFGSTQFAERVAADVKPKLVLGDAALLMKMDPLWPQLAFERWTDSLPQEETGPVEELGPDTRLQILFTSGTTGEPKGIVHTHGNVLASVEPISQGARPYLRYERLVHPLRFLHTLPLSHVFGQTMGLWVPAIFAAEVHFESRLVAPRLIETIKRERISVLAAVPRVMALLKAHLELTRPGLMERVSSARRKTPLTRWWQFRDVHWALGLKFWALISGGGALSGQLEQFWNALGFVVVQGYGMTETTAMITLNHPFHVAKGTIGKPLPGREVKLGSDGEVLVRGPMISNTTWSRGQLQYSGDEWLATGDLAQQQATGELTFLGRKSEVIVTAAGVNLHPEDLEAALEQEPEIRGCAVVPLETANGTEAFAVLALRGPGSEAASVVERANRRLAEFQRLRRWAIWPEPDLPRTSTGKVRRKAVAEWAAATALKDAAGTRLGIDRKTSLETGDWLLGLVSKVTGENPVSGDDRLRLSEDLHLDSLGRVQLSAALEERLGALPEDGAIDQVRTLGELRRLVSADNLEVRESESTDQKLHGYLNLAMRNGHTTEKPAKPGSMELADSPPSISKADALEKFIYPHWPWWKPVAWLRSAFQEMVTQPLVWLLARPRIVGSFRSRHAEPMLIVCNHVTAFDGPLVEYALPGKMRRKIATAMSGEMLEDYRHFRNPDRAPGQRRFMLLGPIAYLLATALFNVFPLPRRRNFQRSFAHAGEALDKGYSVLVFPEGARSAEGELAAFRPGIGLLVKQSQTAVLPLAIRGLGELKARGRGWYRSGTIEVHVGAPLRFAPEETEASITARLHNEVARLLLGDREVTDDTQFEEPVTIDAE